jgi:putative chitinase
VENWHDEDFYQRDDARRQAMIALSQSDIRSLFPKGSPALLGDIAERAPLVLGPVGVLDKPERLAHFLAQASAETGGLSRVVESLRYSAKRIVEVFGPGIHSARIGAAEARRLAGDDYALGERVYGLGNPKKAADLGNVAPGDGFAFRGRGYLQITGRYNYARFGQIIGKPLEDNPDLASDFETALEIAAAYWSARKINAACDAADIVRVTKLVNGGRQGLRHREREFARLAPLIGAIADRQIYMARSQTADIIAAATGTPGDYSAVIADLQQKLGAAFPEARPAPANDNGHAKAPGRA